MYEARVKFQTFQLTAKKKINIHLFSSEMFLEILSVLWLRDHITRNLPPIVITLFPCQQAGAPLGPGISATNALNHCPSPLTPPQTHPPPITPPYTRARREPPPLVPSAPTNPRSVCIIWVHLFSLLFSVNVPPLSFLFFEFGLEYVHFCNLGIHYLICFWERWSSVVVVITETIFTVYLKSTHKS